MRDKLSEILSTFRFTERSGHHLSIDDASMFNYHDKDLQNTRAACEVDIGETVFLTEEDAINELKERKSYGQI